MVNCDFWWNHIVISYYWVGGVLIEVELLIGGILFGVGRCVKGGVLVGVEFLFDGNVVVCFKRRHDVFYEIK